MNHQLSSVKIRAIAQLLALQLQAALELYIRDSSLLTELKTPIPLKRTNSKQRVLYVSAIALQLNQVLKLPPIDIAYALAQCRQTDGQYFTLQVVPPGWIYLEITQSYLAAWLQHLIQIPLELGDQRKKSKIQNHATWRQVLQVGEPAQRTASRHFLHLGKPQDRSGSFMPTALPSSRGTRPTECLGNPSTAVAPKSEIELPLFAVQYAHARCCSLLQMAHREELITLEPTNSDTISALWLAVSPLPIPWLDSEQKLCLSHPSEWGLIFQLIAILDNLYYPYPSRQLPNWHKVALNLSQAFQTFYSHCRIWGEVKSQNLPLAQARLGLILITQSVLRLLLQDKLGSVAPSEV